MATLMLGIIIIPEQKQFQKELIVILHYNVDL